MSRISFTVLAAATALACGTAGAVQRTFVASYGNDANIGTNCGFTNPCRGFTAAQSVTDPGGEIVAIDAAGYGPIAITKSITITANPGFYAGIAASGGDAVSITTPGVNVILRGLNINGIGAVNGVHMTAGASLSIENCVVSNFSNNGVWVQNAAKVRVSDSVIRGNAFDGISLDGGATGSVVRTKSSANGRGIVVLGSVAGALTTTLSVTESDVTANSYGLLATASNATATVHLTISRTSSTNNQIDGVATLSSSLGIELISIGDSQVTGNTNGLNNAAPGGVIESLANNLVRQNGTNTVGTITTVPGI